MLLVTVMACTEVPPGYVGMLLKPDGFSGEILQPGRYAEIGRDRMILIETKEENTSINMKILCADKLNFDFLLNVRTRLRATDAKSVTQLLTKQGAKIRDGILGYDTIIATYVKKTADSITRGVVSKYESLQVQESRLEISKAIQAELSKSLEGTPAELMMVTLSNFDFDDTIDKAMKLKKQREIEIEQEKAEQAKRLLQADNKLKLAEKHKQVRIAQAEAEAASNLILGKSITPEFLEIRRLENQELLYKNIAENDKFFLSGDALPLINIPTQTRQVSNK
jgi:regulator of protease activity HflC (stomatin/prohibitin superfamily)